MKRWEKDSRYYMACVQQDLLGDWTVQKIWGSKITKAGSRATEIVESYDAGQTRLTEIDHIRSRRGYIQIC